MLALQLYSFLFRFSYLWIRKPEEKTVHICYSHEGEYLIYNTVLGRGQTIIKL